MEDLKDVYEVLINIYCRTVLFFMKLDELMNYSCGYIIDINNELLDLWNP